MAFKHGSKAIFKVGNPTATDISQYVSSVSISRSADTAEVTTLGDTSKEYIAGLKDATISVEGYLDAAVNTTLSGLLGQDGTMFEYLPQGGTTPKISGACICTSYEPSTAVDGAGTFSAEFQVTGDVTVA